MEFALKTLSDYGSGSIRMCSIVAQAMCRSACDDMCLQRVEGAHTLEMC